MKKRLAAMLLSLAVLVVSPGCASILNGHMLSVTEHEKPAATSADREIVPSTYDELKTQIIGLIRQHEETKVIHVNSYDGDLASDVNRVCAEIVRDDPWGAYAVQNITATPPTKIVSYYEVVININYRNVSKEQVDGIFTVSTLRYLKSYLQDTLVGYAPSLTVFAKNIDLTQDEALSMVDQIYYENPKDIVMLPVTTVNFYPKDPSPSQGPDRIIEFTFSYRKAYASTILTAMEDNLAKKLQHIVEATPGGKNDGEILLSLCQSLMAFTKYDAVTAGSGDYSNQNTAATAYGALIEGSAIGEGYAMAYKALCDELGIESYVVLGKLHGERHAWNIVQIGGYYYHIDVSMCDVNGLETAFLKSDMDMRMNYTWDTSIYKPCYGPLNYDSLIEVSPSPTTSSTSSPGTSSPSGPSAGPTSSPGARPSPGSTASGGHIT